MFDIKNIVSRWMLEWQIIEEANDRNNVKNKTIALNKQVIRHLVKIYKFNNPRDLKHHSKDITTWLNEISLKKINGGKLPTFKDYYEWLGKDGNYTAADVKTITNSLKSYIENLKIIRTDSEVAHIINNIMYDLSLDLSREEFFDIGDYIEKYPPYKDDKIIDTGDFEYDEELYNRMGW
jgi:hypothetical protein